MELTGIYLVKGPPKTYNIKIEDGRITSVHPNTTPNKNPSILLPSLCHLHIHLDKPFLLSTDYPQYADLVPTSGTFSEALSNTACAKTRYTRSDLERRGSQLIAESIQAGATAMRAFVEVDHVVGFLCLEVASMLKRRFKKVCHVQIVAFAQDPIFSTEHGAENRRLLEEALQDSKFDIDVLGTTPYVETDADSARENIDWAVRTALECNFHLDFHLDYNLDPSREPMIDFVFDTLEKYNWPIKNSSSTTSTPPGTSKKGKTKTIALAHCTRLTLLPPSTLQALTTRIATSDLPISIIGLPTSDLYMMGRPSAPQSSSPPQTQPSPFSPHTDHNKPRGTLNIASLLNPQNPNHAPLNGAIGMNNLLNPFTPSPSNADPLTLASQCVGIYHAGTETDAGVLYGAVSVGARAAIGLDGFGSGEARLDLEVKVGDTVAEGEWMVFEEGGDLELDLEGEGGGDGAKYLRVPARGYRSVRDVVWCPPENGRRRIIR